MKLLDFIETCSLKTQSETEKARLLCFYSCKEQHEVVFTMAQIGNLFSDSSFTVPNLTRLKKNLIKEKSMKETADKNALEFVPTALQRYEREYQELWEDYETIVSDSETCAAEALQKPARKPPRRASPAAAEKAREKIRVGQFSIDFDFSALADSESCREFIIFGTGGEAVKLLAEILRGKVIFAKNEGQFYFFPAIRGKI